MAVIISGAYGLLVRQHARTAAVVKEGRDRMEAQARYLLTARKGEATPQDLSLWMGHMDDGDLIALPAAMNAGDLDGVVADLEAQGLVHHEDFVVTISRQGVVDPMPEWLEEVEPTLRYRLRKPVRDNTSPT